MMRRLEYDTIVAKDRPVAVSAELFREETYG